MTWRIPADIAWCEADPSDAVTVWVVRASTGLIQGLHASAFAIWTAADDRSTVAEVVAELHRSFDIGETDVVAEVSAFLDHLVGVGLLQILGEPE